MKLQRALIATLMFTLLLAGVHYLHMAYLRVDVVFYAALGDALVAAALTSALLLLRPGFKTLGGFEKAQLIIIWLLLGYGFAITIPTVIDRSLSFYILEKLQQRGGGISRDRIRDVFINEYLPEHRLVDVRLTEQSASGTLVLERGCVKLTPKGRRIASFSRFYRQHFLPRQRLLMGEYTDDLTNPFRNTGSSPDYRCE